MNNAVLTVLTLSASGSAIALLLLALKPLIKNRVSKAFLYYAWLIVLLRLALPIAAPEINLMGALVSAPASPPQAQAVQPPALDTQPLADFESDIDPSPAAAGKPSAVNPQAAQPDNAGTAASGFYILGFIKSNLLWIWLAGFAVCFGWFYTAYAVFTHQLRRSLRPPNAADEAVFIAMRGKRPVRLMVSSIVATPMLLGILRPVIVVPQLAYARNGMEDALRYILRHELTHERRKDIIYKWVCVAVTAAHWFNPLMFFIRKQIGTACELACDEAVIRSLTRKQMRDYENTLLALSSSRHLPSGVLATTLCEGKKELKERLTSIMKYKQKTVYTTVLSVVLALLLAGCGAALGTAVNEKTPDNSSIVSVGEKPTPAITEPPMEEPQDSEESTSKEQEPVENSWRSKFPDKFGETESTENSYKSHNINVSVEKFQQDDVTYYVADIYIAELKYLQSAFAGGEYGAKKNAWQLDLAKEKDAVVSITGDFYIVNNGTVLRNGMLYREESGLFCDVCVLNNDGTMQTFSPEDFDIEAAKLSGAWQIWSCGPMLLKDGKAMTEFNSSVAPKNPRAAIGCYEPGHYCFVAVDGRQKDYSLGMTLEELSQLFESLGCKTAYNLDGGQSAAMTFGDSLANHPYDGGRQVSDIVYIGEE